MNRGWVIICGLFLILSVLYITKKTHEEYINDYAREHNLKVLKVDSQIPLFESIGPFNYVTDGQKVYRVELEHINYGKLTYWFRFGVGVNIYIELENDGFYTELQ
jgi:hypothetical protein